MNCQLISQPGGHLGEPSPGRLRDVGGGSVRCDTLKFRNLGLSLLTSGAVHDTLACLTGSGKTYQSDTVHALGKSVRPTFKVLSPSLTTLHSGQMPAAVSQCWGRG